MISIYYSNTIVVGYIWNAAVANNGNLPGGALSQLADIVGWSIGSLQVIWQAYVQGVTRGILATNAIGMIKSIIVFSEI